MINFVLPLPPTINHYYGQRGPRKFIKKDGIQYRQDVQEIVTLAGHPMQLGRLAVFVAVFPANRIRQDIDNRLKSLLDALTHSGVWEDDSQIDDLHIVRQSVIKGGRVSVVITEIEELQHG
jgi:crossover junction endodeoxyribonuclease RusA